MRGTWNWDSKDKGRNCIFFYKLRDKKMHAIKVVIRSENLIGFNIFYINLYLTYIYFKKRAKKKPNNAAQWSSALTFKRKSPDLWDFKLRPLHLGLLFIYLKGCMTCHPSLFFFFKKKDTYPTRWLLGPRFL
jgi:hypothetical protein